MSLTGVCPSRWGKLIQLRIANLPCLTTNPPVAVPLRIIEHPATDLIQLDGFEQCLEVALAKAFVALRWMISKNTGPITVSVKICSRMPSLVGDPSMRMRSSLSAARSSWCPSTRLSTFS